MCGALLLLVVGGARLFSIAGVRRMAEYIVVAGVVLALVGIIQRPLFAGKIYGFWPLALGGNPFGPFVNKNHFAGWMLMALPIPLALMGGVSRARRRPCGWAARWSASSGSPHPKRVRSPLELGIGGHGRVG